MNRTDVNRILSMLLKPHMIGTTTAQHCHHAQWLEVLTEPAENRIQFILTQKEQSERAMRLRCFRPLSPLAYRKLPAKIKKADADRQKAYADRQKAYADWQKADADWQKADADWQKAYAFHKDICGCAWSKTRDIFGAAR